MAERVRAHYLVARDRGVHEVRALQDIAVELELSLADCATAVGREDLLDAAGSSWMLAPSSPPTPGQLVIRPCTEDDLGDLTARWPGPGDGHEAQHARQRRGDAA